MNKQNYTLLYSGNKTGKHEFGTGFYVNKRIMNNFIGFEPVCERTCNIRIKLKFYNMTMISIHAPTEGRPDKGAVL
jgi:hypothetical protein